jgi:uncharacterized iron-regulated membrane protein
MYRTTRQLHRWAGILAALVLIVIAATGFILANKKRFAFVQPPAAQALEIAAAREIVSIEVAVQAAFDLGHDDLRTLEDVDRVDYRPGDNIFKVISNKAYREVQVDGKTGKVLTNSFRTDQLMEDIHDLSFFAAWTHAWVLPLVALVLFGLSVSGVGMFLTPVYRRWAFRKNQRNKPEKP